MSDLSLDFHGVRVHVRCPDDEISRRVAKDFSHFAAGDAEAQPTAKPDLTINAYRQAPDYASLPPLKASIYSPRNICYTNGQVTFIDYFGRALSIYDRSRQALDIYSDQLHLLHEIIFLTMLSRVCEQLERRRMHRVHALAVELNGQCAMFLMPSGCGKTTLCMEFLKRDVPYRLVSEDSPLISRGGRVLPFPLRFGVLADSIPDVPEEDITFLERMEFEPKYLVSLEAFAESISSGSSVPRMVFIGDRTLAATCRIRKARFGAGFRAFVRHMIVGVGLYQGIEFLLQTSVTDLVTRSGMFASRLLAALAVLRQSKVFALELGRDPEQNASTIISFLDEHRLGHKG